MVRLCEAAAVDAFASFGNYFFLESGVGLFGAGGIGLGGKGFAVERRAGGGEGGGLLTRRDRGRSKKPWSRDQATWRTREFERETRWEGRPSCLWGVVTCKWGQGQVGQAPRPPPHVLLGFLDTLHYTY